MGSCVRIKQKIITVGDRNVIFTLILNLMMFFFNPFYIYVVLLILWNMKEMNVKNKQN